MKEEVTLRFGSVLRTQVERKRQNLAITTKKTLQMVTDESDPWLLKFN